MQAALLLWNVQSEISFFFISRQCLTLDSIFISFVIIILILYHRPEYWEQFISTIYELRFYSQILFLPIVLYVPALAFNQGKFHRQRYRLQKNTPKILTHCFVFTVTGANIYIISAIVCVVCVFYTYIGGIKVMPDQTFKLVCKHIDNIIVFPPNRL